MSQHRNPNNPSYKTGLHFEDDNEGAIFLTEANTPMMKQYEAIKKQYPGTLLFFRLGDFYEMFGEDALIGSRELEITLTGRGAGAQGRMPMCGVPYHAAEGYIARLIAKGYKVAICEQMEDPKAAKGIVKRDVIRVITPGTVVDSNLLQNPAANFLAAVWPGEGGFGLAHCDISTGQLWVTEIKGNGALTRLGDELERIHPAECLLPESLLQQEYFQLQLWNSQQNTVLTALDDPAFLKRNAKELILTHFQVSALQALGLEEMTLGICAVSAILQFATGTQKRELPHINQVQCYQVESFMLLDGATRRNLELTQTMRQGQKKGSLLWVLDGTLTALGSRLLRQWVEKPLLNSIDINQRLNMVDELSQDPLRLSTLQEHLKGIYDLERLAGRIAYGNAGPRDLVSLKQSLTALPALDQILASFTSSLGKSIYDDFDLLEDVRQRIDTTLNDEPPISPKDGGLIRPGFHPEVDELRELTSTGKNVLLQMEATEKEKTGIKSLKIGFNKVFGYYIEVTRANLNLVPAHYIRKQTLANAERYVTEELKEWENRILGAGEKLLHIEYELFVELRQAITKETRRIQRTAACIAQLDVLQALTQTALTNGYCKPLVDDGEVIEIVAGRHPVVEKSIGRENYIPNDVLLDNGQHQFALITGPNMAGKSTYMRQVALCVLLARIGSFVPAQRAHIGKVDRIFTRVGASDDLAAGQSTFMVEMCETSNILRHATKSSLVLMDEIGRGTSTYDGLSIAWAVAEYLLLPNSSPRTLFATHYHELTDLAEEYPQIKNLSIAVREKDGDIIFLRKIVAGSADKSYGIQVAKLAGLPPAVLVRAQKILAALEDASSGRESVVEHLSQHSMAEAVATSRNIQEEEVLQNLKETDVNNLRPLDALMLLEKWQTQLKGADHAG